MADTKKSNAAGEKDKRDAALTDTPKEPSSKPSIDQLDAAYEKGAARGYEQALVELNDRLHRCNQKACGKMFPENSMVVIKDAHVFCSRFCALIGA